MALPTTQIASALPAQMAVAVRPLPGKVAGLELAAQPQIAPAVQRLVVLIPDSNVNELSLARAVWLLASPNHLPVALVGICSRRDREPLARRRLATLAVLIRDSNVQVEVEIYSTPNWLEALSSQVKRGDQVVCQAEQRIRSRLVRVQPLAAVIAKRIEAPVVTLSGFYPELRPDPADGGGPWLMDAAPFVVFILISLFQFWLYRLTGGTAQTLLMLISVIVEFGLIGLWNSFYNR